VRDARRDAPRQDLGSPELVRHVHSEAAHDLALLLEVGRSRREKVDSRPFFIPSLAVL
jgi:hypothetical protein